MPRRSSLAAAPRDRASCGGLGTENQDNDENQVDPGPPMFRMRTHRKTKQNLTLVFSFNGVGVAAVVTGFDIPAWAMIAMVSSVNAVLTDSLVHCRLNYSRVV